MEYIHKQVHYRIVPLKDKIHVYIWIWYEIKRASLSINHINGNKTNFLVRNKEKKWYEEENKD